MSPSKPSFLLSKRRCGDRTSFSLGRKRYQVGSLDRTKPSSFSFYLITRLCLLCIFFIEVKTAILVRFYTDITIIKIIKKKKNRNRNRNSEEKINKTNIMMVWNWVYCVIDKKKETGFFLVSIICLTRPLNTRTTFALREWFSFLIFVLYI